MTKIFCFKMSRKGKPPKGKPNVKITEVNDFLGIAKLNYISFRSFV